MIIRLHNEDTRVVVTVMPLADGQWYVMVTGSEPRAFPRKSQALAYAARVVGRAA
jgi:hypothetical protein